MASRATAARQDAARTARRAALRRGLPLLGVLLGFGTAGAVAVDYMREPGHLPLEVIRVTGALRHLRGAEIEAAVAEAIDGNFFTVDMERIRDRVRALAWVDQVSVRRLWPRTLVMEVTEQVPVARWGGDALVNARGEVFRPDAGLAAISAVRLDGPEGSSARVVRFYREVASRLASSGLRLRRLELDERREWRFELDDGLAVMLGQSDLRQRLQWFLVAHRMLGAEPLRRPDRVDLRYPQGLAVSWREVEGAAAPKARTKTAAGDA